MPPGLPKTSIRNLRPGDSWLSPLAPRTQLCTIRDLAFCSAALTLRVLFPTTWGHLKGLNAVLDQVWKLSAGGSLYLFIFLIVCFGGLFSWSKITKTFNLDPKMLNIWSFLQGTIDVIQKHDFNIQNSESCYHCGDNADICMVKSKYFVYALACESQRYTC